MEEMIIMTEISMPNEEDWSYYLQNTPDNYLQGVLVSLLEENRFFADYRFLKLLWWYVNKGGKFCTTELTIKKDSSLLYRARVYSEEKDKAERERERVTEKDNNCFLGYNKTGSFIPPKGAFVGNGRANPSGITYLYTANDPLTAIAEVNPPLKAEVSVATIVAKENLRILNFANLHSASAGEDTARVKWIRDFVLALTRIYNTPVLDENYLLCQYVSEFAKNIGFDGISFRSSKVKIDFIKNEGINFVIFKHKKCEAVSSELYYIFDRNLEVKRKDSLGSYHTVTKESL